MEDSLEKWKNKIGEMIVNFGEIERATYQVWVYYGKEIKDAPKEFTRRCGKVIGLIDRDSSIDGKTKEMVKDAFSRANELAQQRNDYAHNPVQVNLYEHPDTKELSVAAEVNQVLSGETLSYEQLCALVDEINNLAENIYNIIPLPLMYTGDG